MPKLSSIKLSNRRLTLDSAFTDWVDWHRRDARGTFLYSGGPSPYPHTSKWHLAGWSLEDGESQPDGNDGESHANKSGDASDSLGTRSNSYDTSNEIWINHDESGDKDKEKDYDLGGAPGWGDSPPPVAPPKEQWGPHCGHKYGITNIERVGSAWRYDVVTDVEIYRISTIPEDFIGSSLWNNWTHEMNIAYDRYKEVDHLSEVLENTTMLMSEDEADITKNLHQLRYETALGAATARIDFLRKWPNAFEKDQGTFGHWERALWHLEKAESARLDGVRASEKHPR